MNQFCASNYWCASGVGPKRTKRKAGVLGIFNFVFMAASDMKLAGQRKAIFIQTKVHILFAWHCFH